MARKKAKNPVRVTNRRVADENNHVVTVVGGDSSFCRTPCKQCPWRKANAGSFPAEAFRHSANTAQDMADHTFGCHMTGVENPATCAGFLLSKTAEDSMAVRIRLMKGEIDPSKIKGNRRELFSTYRKMAEANGVPKDDPALEGCMPEARSDLIKRTREWNRRRQEGK